MDTEAPAVETRTFVDRMGDTFDEMGIPRIAGRLFGWLLICEPPEQSSAQLAEAVEASAGSVSTMMRLLERGGLAERIGQPGSRKVWYRIRPDAFEAVLMQRVRQVTGLRELAEEGIRELEQEGRQAERLREMRRFYAFFERELPALVAKYVGKG